MVLLLVVVRGWEREDEVIFLLSFMYIVINRIGVNIRSEPMLAVDLVNAQHLPIAQAAAVSITT
jgi:hypothetical protein